ncbi:MAG: hypothetical protein ACK5HL_00750, partial [Bacilli bacterium]
MKDKFIKFSLVMLFSLLNITLLYAENSIEKLKATAKNITIENDVNEYSTIVINNLPDNMYIIDYFNIKYDSTMKDDKGIIRVNTVDKGAYIYIAGKALFTIYSNQGQEIEKRAVVIKTKNLYKKYIDCKTYSKFKYCSDYLEENVSEKDFYKEYEK